jgi:hypothetical protein
LNEIIPTLPSAKSNFTQIQTAESRLFPIGHPNHLIPHSQGPVSPFDVAQFSNSLLPLISAGIREKVKGIAKTFNEGFDYVEDSIRDGWKESPLNPYNYDRYLNKQPPNLLKFLPFNHPNSPQPAKHQHTKAHKKAPKSIETHTMSKDKLMREYGINGYKHFEDTILREIEKQEELKVEATIHTLFGKGDQVEIIRGKPYEEHKSSGWKPVAAPTKIYDDTSNDISSQIISPLHTSIFSASEPSVESLPPLNFHDFDSMHADTIQSTYSVHDDNDERHFRPVKAKIASIKRVTPVQPVYTTETPTKTTRSTTTRSRVKPTTVHKKRHNNSQLKTSSEDNAGAVDTSTSASNNVPVIALKTKRNPPRFHIQSLTTSKPKNHSNVARNVSDEVHGSESSSASSIGVSNTSRFRVSAATKTPTTTTVSTTSVSRTTRSTTKRSKTVQREVSKYVDRARTSGYRGSIKYGQSAASAK